ncbi:hypothetical protein WJX72_010287 [[Myrmecia] bisecta]|uniref:Lipid droplet-associated hydrolase n=1 Tax=[Myrmecia] bisecta TaxID=41462 RepID=A0AAW1P7C7_9CHLO
MSVTNPDSARPARQSEPEILPAEYAGPVVWHGCIQTGTQSVEAYRVAATQGQALVQLLVLPGNPGSAAFYVPFLRGLHAAWQGRAEVTAISHLGHGALGPHSTQLYTLLQQISHQLYTLRQQISHQVAFIRQHLLLPGRPPLAIMGHSIGAYMALHAAHRVEEADSNGQHNDSCTRPRICKIVGVFPFLTVDPGSLKQKFLRCCTRIPGVMGGAAALLGMLPPWLLKLIVQLGTKGGMDEHAVAAALDLLREPAASNAFYLGQTEFTDLASPADWWLLEQFGPRAAILCAPQDVWFPHWKWEEMWLKVPGVEAYMEELQRHDFCVSVELSAQMARRTASIVNRALDNTVRNTAYG